MRTNRWHTPLLAAVAAVAALAAIACGSGGIGDILGGPSGDTASRPPDVRGWVVDVDAASRRLVLDSDDPSTRSLQRQGDRTVYYDDRTVVEFEGETYRPENLERGDQVRVRFARQEDSNLAERITVLSDVRADDPGDFDDDFPTVVRGTVRYIDSGDRLIEVEELDDRERTRIAYDERTVVVFEGKQYKPESLEQGDEISVTVERRGDELLADRITVDRDATPATGTGTDAPTEVRGTVSELDTRARWIELDLDYGDRGDERVYYDERTVVDLDGRRLRPESLREGDEVAVSGTRRDNRFLADTIQVLREARSTE